MAPTLRDIAKKANVSYTAVSDILNRGKAGKYSDTTISSVQQIASHLGYEANQAAKALKMGRTKTIGIVDPYGLVNSDADPYFMNLMTGIASRAAAAGYTMSLINTAGRNPEGALLPDGIFADGLIYISLSKELEAFKDEYVPRIEKQRTPGVIIHANDAPFSVPNVGLDCTAGGYAVTEHLIREHGYTEIGFFITEFPYAHHLNIFRGYCRALAENGLSACEAHIYRSEVYDADSAYHAMEEALQDGTALPRALVCAADPLAFGAISCLRDHGLNVPADMAVTGFGDEVKDNYLGAGLTTVNQHSRERGMRAVDMVLEKINGNADHDEPETVIMEPELVVRKTCGCE